MSNWWQNLNLTPQERKFVIGVVLVFAIVLNFLFIWPQFSKWTPVQAELETKRTMLAEYEAKIAERKKQRRTRADHNARVPTGHTGPSFAPGFVVEIRMP